MRTCTDDREIRAALAGRARGSASCRRWARSTTGTSRSLAAGARRERHGRREPLRQPDAVRPRARTSTATRATRSTTRRSPRRGRRRPCCSRRPPRRCTRPGSRPGSRSRSSPTSSRGSTAPGTSAASPPSAWKLFAIVRPDRAYFGQKDAQQVAVSGGSSATSTLGVEIRVPPAVREPDGSRCPRATPTSRRRGSAARRSRPAGARRGDPRRATPAARARLLRAVEAAVRRGRPLRRPPSSPPPPASAPPV